MQKLNRRVTLIIFAVIVAAVVYYVGVSFFYEPPASEHCEVKTWYESAQARGGYRIPIDVYLADSQKYPVSLTDMEIQTVINGTNTIWKNYEIQFYIADNSIKRVEVPDDYVLLGRSGNTTIDGTNLGKKVAGHRFSDDIIDIIFINTFHFVGGGIGLNYDGIHVAIVSQHGYMSWVLAHELAHVLNNRDESKESGIFTLLTHDGCIPERYQPSILNQTQYDLALEKIATIRHENLTKSIIEP